MASTYSTNLGLELIGTGDQAGTWGLTTNTNLGTLLEQAVAGYADITVNDTTTATALTLPNGASGTGRNMILRFIGTLTANRTVSFPNSPSKTKLLFVENATTGGFSVTVQNSTGGTGVAVANGNRMALICNGTNVVNAITGTGATPGDVTGPSSAADNAITRFDGATGKLIQASACYIEDSGNLGIGFATPVARLHVDGGQYINSLGSLPALGTSIVSGEIHGARNNSAADDSGYLRLSAGGGTTGAVKAAIDIARDIAGTSEIRAYTSGVERTRVGTTGNWTFYAPTSGVLATFNGFAANHTIVITSGNTGSNTISDMSIVRAAGTANSLASGASIQLGDAVTNAAIWQCSGGQSEFWAYMGGAWRQVQRIETTRRSYVNDGADVMIEVGYRDVPIVTGGIERGKCYSTTAGVTFGSQSAGAVFTVYNNSASSITLTESSITMRLAGTTTTGNRTLAARGLATVFYVAGSECIVSGAGVT